MSTWDRAAAAHLHRRAGFGADRARLERAVESGRETALEDLFGRREQDPELESMIRPLLGLDEIEHLQSWWMSLLCADGAPLVERVALMWHDHFATSNDKVDDVRLMYGQLQLFRRQGLGDFRALLHAAARDPAMLVWLDGNANRKGQPNENFAREVLELFALGIGNYTEHDVQEAARAFTGWGVDGRAFTFRRQYHDEGEKEVLGRRGAFDGDAVLDVILAHPACARHVARRLLAEFVLPEPAPEDIEAWAAILVECEWSIERTLARLLRSELFGAAGARRARIAGPVELVATTAVTLGVRPSSREAARAAADMGQALFRPPSVKGWDGGRAWIHAGSWLARHDHLVELAMAAPEDELSASVGAPKTATDVPDAVLALLLPEGAEADLRAVLADAAAAAPDTGEALRRAIALVLSAPEYHLT